MMQTAYTAPGAMEQARVNRIHPGDLGWALRRGWSDFMAAPTQIFFLCLVYPLFGLVVGRAAAGSSLLPMVWPLLAGFTLVAPAAALGLYEISRRREQGREVTWRDMFGVLRSPALPGILLLGLVLAAVFLLWIGTARLIYHSHMGPGTPEDMGALLDGLLHTASGHRVILYGNIAGAGFALLVLASTAISFPMMLDRAVSPGEAAWTSLSAFCASPATFLLWGILVAALIFVGMATVVGLALVLPVLGHATWHLYREAVR